MVRYGKQWTETIRSGGRTYKATYRWAYYKKSRTKQVKPGGKGRFQNVKNSNQKWPPIAGSTAGR